MIRKSRLLLILCALVVALATAAILASRADARRRASEAQAALKRAAEFLQPDTTSDLRFGKGKTESKAPSATPAPATR